MDDKQIVMNVVQLHNYYRFCSGEKVMFESIIHMLEHYGHDVHIFKRDSFNIQGLQKKIHAFCEGIYSNSAKKDLSNILASKQWDLVHIHNVYPLISPSVLHACRQYNVPVVMSCHNYRLICPTGVFFDGSEICERCQNGREYWCVLKNCRGKFAESIGYSFRNMLSRKMRFYLDNVTLFIPPSEYVKQRLVDNGFPKERIIVLPNMISVTHSNNDHSCGEYVAYAGQITLEKGIKTLLASARQTGLNVRLAGDYAQMPEIRNSAPKNVKFVGLLNHLQLDDFYRNARFLVVPSIWYEVFGLVITEAMSHSLPIIASRIGGIPEIVDDGVTGFLVEPGNPEELAEKMKLLWENPDLCRKMGEAGRKKVLQEYSEEAYYDRLIAVYRKAIQLKSKDIA